MTYDREELLKMLAAGKINVAEADRLLQQMERTRGSGWWWLLNPFARLSARAALWIAGATMLVQLGLSFARVRFDGALDSHPAGPAGVSLGAALLDAVVSWPLTAAVFWLGALAVARQGRFVDFLGAVGVARVPMVFSGAVLAVVEAFLPITHPGPRQAAGIAVLTALTLPCIVWFFALLFQGFRTASGLRGPRVGLSFVAVLIVAEFVSKLVLRLS